MKRISKFTRLFAVTIMATLLAVVPTFAVETDDTENPIPLSSANLCIRISSIMTDNTARITERRETLTSNYDKRLTAIESRRTSAEEKLASSRQEVANTFEEKINELKALENLSDEQLAAIDTFKTDMTTAEATRQEAVDTARNVYQSSLRQTVSERQELLSEAAATYSSAIKAAFEKAKSNCSSSSALTTMRSDIKAARNAFAAVCESTKSTDEITTLAETRNTAIQEANQAFRTAVKEAADALASALEISINITAGSDTESPTTEP